MLTLSTWQLALHSDGNCVDVALLGYLRKAAFVDEGGGSALVLARPPSLHGLAASSEQLLSHCLLIANVPNSTKATVLPIGLMGSQYRFRMGQKQGFRIFIWDYAHVWRNSKLRWRNSLLLTKFCSQCTLKGENKQQMTYWRRQLHALGWILHIYYLYTGRGL